MNHASGLLGAHAFDQAKINEWISWCQTSWMPHQTVATDMIFGQVKHDSVKFNNAVKALKTSAKVLENYLK